ncbi:MAG: PDZ domain-containing protein [Parcubacteria group bacterium]|nr:PDZ domain-containing protein [Parcubacteria group bacterium]
MKLPSKTLPFVFLSLLIIGISFLAGTYVGYENRAGILKVSGLINKETPVTAQESLVDFSPFWDTWNAINEKYVPATNGATSSPQASSQEATTGEVTAQDKVWGAIQGLVDSLGDPYSVFLPPEDSEVFEENIQGNFGGVGMEIGMRDDTLTVITPIKDTPAERAGIEAGDKILKIGDTITADISLEDAVRLIRGEIGTEVVFTIVREGRKGPFDVAVKRAIITIPTIDTELRKDGVFVIQLYNFSGQSPRLFRESLREFVLSGSNKLILDLRGNPGGFLEAAVEISSWFLPAGKIIVTEDFGPGKEDLDIIYRSRGYDVFNENLKMAILVDKGSASAAEIMAGALAEHKVAVLVGDKTFGKGSVQELIKITQDTSLKLTVAHWRTPEGTLISKDGITPLHMVKMTDEDREKKKDPQLDKAVALLLSQ